MDHWGSIPMAGAVRLPDRKNAEVQIHDREFAAEPPAKQRTFGRDDPLAKGDCSVRKLLQIRCSENEPLYFTTSGFRPGNGAETN